MKRITITLMSLSVVQMLASYAQRMVLAYYFGASSELDAYFLCLTIPSTLIFFFIALGTAASPVTTRFEEEGDIAASRQLWGTLFWLVVLIVGVITPLLIWRAPDIVKLSGAKLNNEQQTANLILRILIVGQFGLLGISALVGNIQRLKGRFILAKLTVLTPFLTLVFGVILFHARLGVISIAVSLVSGNVLAMIVDVVAVRREVDFTAIKRILKFRLPAGFRTVVRQALPVTILSLNGQLLTAADNVMAAAIGAGALSVFTYAYGIFQIPQIVFTQASTLVKTPDLFKQAARRDDVKFSQNIYETMESTLFLIIPSTVGLLILRTPLIRVMLEHGNFHRETTAAVAHLLLYFGPVSILWAMWLCLGRPLIALQRASSVMVIELIMTALSIGLNFIFRAWLGLPGLVLSTVLAMSFTIAGFLIVIRRQIVIISLMEIGRIICRASVAACLMGAVCLIGQRLVQALTQSDLLDIFIVSTIGVLVYLAAANTLKIKDAQMIVGQIFGGWRRLRPRFPARPAATMPPEESGL